MDSGCIAGHLFTCGVRKVSENFIKVVDAYYKCTK